MPINWFTVAAQAVNFLILVWLLKRFLYQPILRAIDKRERGIADQLAQADAQTAEAKKDREAFQHKNEALDSAAAKLMQKATDEANAQRQRLLEAARHDADALTAQRQEALQSEQRNLGQEITRWTQKEVFAISRQALASLADSSLEERMADIFVQRLRALQGSAKTQWIAALHASTQPACVRSAFELPAAQRTAIESALKDTIAPETKIEFETAPQLVSGIEISANGCKLAWSIADYLATLEKSVAAVLPGSNSKSEAQAPAPPKPVSNNGLQPVAAGPKADH